MSPMLLISHELLKSKGIDLSKKHLWRLERAGRFPRRVRVSPARVAWLENEVDTWLAGRIADRPTQGTSNHVA